MLLNYQTLIDLKQNIVHSKEQFENIIAKLNNGYTVNLFESDNKKVIFVTILKNDDQSFTHLWYISLDYDDIDLEQAYSLFLMNA